MIKALIFDLDGTLIQTEVLKARSYAKALSQLTKNKVSEEMVLNSFEMLVGLSRPEVVAGLYKKYKNALRENLSESEAEIIQDKISTERLAIYHEMLNDEALLMRHFCQFNLELLNTAHKDDYRTNVATMSHKKEATKVIGIMGIADKLELVLTRDNVSKGKPDPEIYLKAKNQLGLTSEECLVIEDSVNGIKAGLAAGMHVFAVTNSITKKSVHACKLLEPKYIVDDPKTLRKRVYDFIEEVNGS